MRYAMIMAGGSGTRLWPMSRSAMPKQLIPFIRGKSLIQIASERLEGLVPLGQQYICAGMAHRDAILRALPGFDPQRYLAEPTGRDTLNAVGFAAAVIARRDPQAVMAVFTADHVIEPVARFQEIVARGYEIAEQQENVLVTFGIAPTHAATAYGYLQLGQPLAWAGQAYRVERFQEKPDEATARQYLDAGPGKYLWNSGMFVWRAATLLACLQRYAPQNYAKLQQIAAAWDTPQRDAVVRQVYPTLPKNSVDFAIMEPASRAPDITLAAVPMDLSWLDVGSWPAFAQTCEHDGSANALAAGRHTLIDTSSTLIASSEADHLITAIGCEDLIIVHTPDATLVCRADRAQDIKKLHQLLADQWGAKYL
jgi:mannose-1-phosphate guanylyltransferase